MAISKVIISPKSTIITIIVTTDRPDELALTLDSVGTQSIKPDKVLVIDTGNNPRTPEIVDQFPLAEHIHSKANLGGAGGFAFGMLSALARGADYVWVMDDDGRPEQETCLAELVQAMQKHQLEAVAPLVIDPDDPARLSFPHRFKGRYHYERELIEKIGVIHNFTHLFNGALFHKSVFFRAGIPDMRLFIRGDEVEFMHRMLQAKIRLATITATAFVHPSGWNETVPLIENRLHAVVPDSDLKKYCFFRNRGYIARNYGLYKHFIYDMLRYTYYFLVTCKGDWKGLSLFISATKDGVLKRFKYPLL